MALGLTGSESIEQNIAIILKTRKGEVPFRPNFGFGLEEWIDKVNWQIGLASEVIEQLETYEPRIKIIRVLPKSINNAGAALVIFYINKLTEDKEQATFQITA